MKRLIWLPLAGFLLVAGAAVAAAAPTVGSVAEQAVGALTDTSETDTAVDMRFGRGDLLEDVLADLVGAGTITQEQSDAIVQALEDEIEARQTAAEEHRELIQGFMEDGVITQEEIDQLPADSPMREMWNSIAEDGEVSLDQLRQLGPGGFGPGRGPGFGHGHRGNGPGFFGPTNDSTDSTDTSTGTSSNS